MVGNSFPLLASRPYHPMSTNVGFLVDFLLPTIIGCMPMILQNTSIGSLASADVASASGAQRSQIWSYVFPLPGISSSILNSLRIKKYSASITNSDDSSAEFNSTDTHKTTESLSKRCKKGPKGK